MNAVLVLLYIHQRMLKTSNAYMECNFIKLNPYIIFLLYNLKRNERFGTPRIKLTR